MNSHDKILRNETPRSKRVTNFSVVSLLDLNVTSPTGKRYSSSASPNPQEVPSKSRNVSGDAENHCSNESGKFLVH